MTERGEPKKGLIPRGSKKGDCHFFGDGIYFRGMDEDIRWKQRFHNYQKALAALKSAVELAETRALTDLEKRGIICSTDCP